MTKKGRVEQFISSPTAKVINTKVTYQKTSILPAIYINAPPGSPPQPSYYHNINIDQVPLIK